MNLHRYKRNNSIIIQRVTTNLFRKKQQNHPFSKQNLFVFRRTTLSKTRQYIIKKHKCIKKCDMFCLGFLYTGIYMV